MQRPTVLKRFFDSSNILRVAAINSVGTFVLFLGKAAVVASTGMYILKLLFFPSNDTPINYFNFYSSDWDSDNANSRGHGETSVGSNNFGSYFCLYDC